MEAFVRLRGAPDGLYQRFCVNMTTTSEPRLSAWATLLANAGRTDGVEPDSDDEDVDDEVDEDELEAEAEALANGEGEVEVAPSTNAPPLQVLELEALEGTWCDSASNAPLATTVGGVGMARLRKGGRTVGDYRGELKGGKPHGYGRLELVNGDGWRGEMVVGCVGGDGEAWDEAGNRFTGCTQAPVWLV